MDLLPCLPAPSLKAVTMEKSAQCVFHHRGREGKYRPELSRACRTSRCAPSPGAFSKAGSDGLAKPLHAGWFGFKHKPIKFNSQEHQAETSVTLPALMCAEEPALPSSIHIQVESNSPACHSMQSIVPVFMRAVLQARSLRRQVGKPTVGVEESQPIRYLLLRER